MGFILFPELVARTQLVLLRALGTWATKTIAFLCSRAQGIPYLPTITDFGLPFRSLSLEQLLRTRNYHCLRKPPLFGETTTGGVVYSVMQCMKPTVVHKRLLVSMHMNAMAHRDIEPGNIMQLN